MATSFDLKTNESEGHSTKSIILRSLQTHPVVLIFLSRLSGCIGVSRRRAHDR